jgi:hypothetical protein
MVRITGMLKPDYERYEGVRPINIPPSDPWTAP